MSVPIPPAGQWGVHVPSQPPSETTCRYCRRTKAVHQYDPAPNGVLHWWSDPTGDQLQARQALEDFRRVGISTENPDGLTYAQNIFIRQLEARSIQEYGTKNPNGKEATPAEVLLALVATATVTLLIGLAIYLVLRDFRHSTTTGLRGLSATLLPLLVAVYVLTTSATPAEWPQKVHPLATFTVFTFFSFMAMNILSLSRAVPIAELAFSSALAVLVVALVRSSEASRAISYPLGILVGALGYMVTVGVPHF